ncbi:hypothetical protein [Wenyingzhuangia fucanilytica]|nr:hypothetical protein [Wenyingzhuangia fucanilytica]
MNIFLSGTQRMNRGHLASIVKIARSNNKLSREEITLLKKIKADLGISDLAFRSIIRNPDLYPINPPSNYEERIERLYALANMLHVDKESYDLSLKLLEKLAVGIGFPLKTHEEVVKVAVELARSNADLETFTVAIRKANSTKE